MMPRSQIAALAVLLVGLGVVLALVGTAGVSTGVFSTATPVPTATPSPTPLPEASGDNWAVSAPGQLTYAADPNIGAQIVYQTAASMDELTSLTGLAAPAADDPYPLITMLTEIYDELTTQASDSQLVLAPDAFTGPVIEIVEDIPVSMMRLQLNAQTTGAGQEFPGLDLVQMFIQHPDDQITFVQYVLSGEPNQAVYNDFRAWLSANITDIVAEQAAATATPEVTPAPTTEPGATEQATPEAATPQEATPEATVEAAATPEVVTPETTEEAAVIPETTEAAEVVITPNAAEAATPQEKWLELAPGQLMYAANPSAYIQYTAAPMDEFAASVGAEVTDTPLTAEDILNALRARLEAQLEEGQIAVEEGAFEGPTAEEIDGVTFTYLHLTLQPQTTSDGQARPAQDVEMGVIMTGDNRVTAVQFIYQGDPIPASTTIFVNGWRRISRGFPRWRSTPGRRRWLRQRRPLNRPPRAAATRDGRELKPSFLQGRIAIRPYRMSLKIKQKKRSVVVDYLLWWGWYFVLSLAIWPTRVRNRCTGKRLMKLCSR